jgi:4-hydroxy-tetrahydrodipicolinate reductase
MGQAVMRTVAARDDLQLAGLWVRNEKQPATLDLPSDTLVSSDILAVAAAADVVIDFSLPDATSEVLAAVVEHGKSLVCGVSGLAGTQMDELDAAAKSVAIVYDRNMSLGVAVLDTLVRQAAAALGADFDVEVHETHHVHKIDAPSGTALKLGEAIAEARGIDAGEVHYESERRGEVPGDHLVIFSSPAERLELSHSVTTRQVFADGAIRAARWVVDQPAGRYSIQDVLTLEDPD